MNDIIIQDVSDIVDRFGDKWQNFRGKTILITGATGLIGSMLTRGLICLNKEKDANIKIILVVRNKQSAEELFGLNEKIMVIEQNDIADVLNINDKIDYIVHTASPANSKYYVEEPVETIDAICTGSKRIFELGKEKEVSKIVSISSMEVYGTHGDRYVDEDEQGKINLYNVRSSYPLGKQVAEFCGYAYFKEYNVPVISMRLAMCFGAGQKVSDRRVHKIFCDAGLKGENIEVKSSGKTVVNFVYSADAILAILLLLVDGEPGNVYNVAGDSKDYTIMDMAKYIAKATGVDVEHNYSPEARFEPDNLMKLNTEKIRALGWVPKYNIEDALDRYLEYLK